MGKIASNVHHFHEGYTLNNGDCRRCVHVTLETEVRNDNVLFLHIAKSGMHTDVCLDMHVPLLWVAFSYGSRNILNDSKYRSAWIITSVLYTTHLSKVFAS